MAKGVIFMVDDRMGRNPFVYPTMVSAVQDGVFSPVEGNTPVNMIATRTARRDQDSSDLVVAAPPTAPPNDLRARLRAKDNFRANNLIYAGPASILKNTGGVVWPYNPTVTYSQDVLYSSMDIVHTNQEILSYTRTPATKITVAGQFTAQTHDEGLYCLGCIHFLRTVTKMSFGRSIDPQAGTPPPVLLFDAHGPGMFKALPVVVTNFSVALPPDPDYILVRIPGTSQPTRVPSVFDITVAITVQNTPQNLRKWSLDEFRAGVYLAKGGYV